MDRFVVRVAWFLTLGLLTSACGGGSSSTSSAPTPTPVAVAPKINVTSALALEAGINETSVADVRIANTGDASLTYSAASSADWLTLESPIEGTISPANERTLSLRATCGSQSQTLESAVSLTTNDPEAASLSVPITLQCEDNDLAVARVLLNQGVRAYDSLANTPQTTALIANRELLVRVFATASTNTVPTGQVIVSVPGSADTTIALNQPAAIAPTAAGESLLNGSHYAVVPASAVQADMSVLVVLAPDTSAPVRYPAIDSIEPNVRALPDFEVTFVPVTFEGQTPTFDVNERMTSSRKLLPIGGIDAVMREPYTFTGTYDLSRLLDEIRVLRDLDNANSFYHAIIPQAANFVGGTAGIGYVGFPVSVSMDLRNDPYLIAHELGHNLSREHAPGCNTPSPDVNYPDPLGGIGSWGFDFQTVSLIDPTQGGFDFMSYCTNLWVSDYGFEQMAAFRDGRSGATSTGNQGARLASQTNAADGSYVVSGQMHRSGNAITIKNLIPNPNAAPAVTSGRYRFIARDAAGTIVAHARFDAVHVDHSDISGFSFRIPTPASSIYHIEVSDGDQVVYEQVQARAPRVIQPATIQTHNTGNTTLLRWNHHRAAGAVIRNAAGRVISIDKTGQLALSSTDAVTVEVFGDGWQTHAKRIQPAKSIARGE